MCNMDCFHCELEDCIMDIVTSEEKEEQDQRDMKVLMVFHPEKYSQKLYKQSEKGKEAKKRYKQSEKGMETQKRYQQSEKGREAQKRYRESKKKKELSILNLSESFRSEE